MEAKEKVPFLPPPPQSFTERLFIQIGFIFAWAFGEQNLLVTNVVIYMSFGALGDFLEQRHMMMRGQLNLYDWYRTRTFVLAACPIGFAAHYWYKWLDKTYPENTFKIVIKKVAAIRTVGILLLVYIKENLKKHLRGVEKHKVNTGQMNLGNKGGVSVRLDIKDTSLCFINCHLAAGDGDDSFRARNDDFLRICNQLRFPDSFRSIFDHDVLFWMGDLNYRLQTSKNGSDLDIITVKKKCALGDIESLLNFDQLREIQNSRRSRHHEFTEGDITFLPTYKYDTGTDNWDSSEKNRVPSWCDRILWIDKTKWTQLKEYNSIQSIRISDHKPVRALFKARARLVNTKRQMQVRDTAIKVATKLENEALPNVLVDPCEIDFGCVQFLSPKVKYLTLKNIGKYSVKCRFKRQLESEATCKPWLIVSPQSVKIDPNQEEYITVQLLVDKDTANDLNCSGPKEMTDILLLHLVGGRDFFIFIRALYEPTCFACSLEDLVQAQSNTTNEQLLISFDEPDICPKPVEYKNIPKELWRMVEFIRSEIVRSTNLFGGSHKDFDLIRNMLDKDIPFPPGESTRTSVMEALTIFLDSLPRRVIPEEYLESCIELVLSPQSSSQFIDSLPSVHAATFRYMLQFGRDILCGDKHSDNVVEEDPDAPVITLDDICFQFAYLLFPSVDIHNKPALSQGRREIVRKFIKYCIEFDSVSIPQLT